MSHLTKIGSRLDQHFPELLSELEKQILLVIFRNDKFTVNEIKKLSAYLQEYNPKSIYNALSRMETKGFVFNQGEDGLVCYTLTKVGKAQAEWYAGRLLS